MKSKKHTNIRVMWGLVCSLSSIDQEKNNISLFNVINQVNVSATDFEKAKSGGHKGLIIPISHELVIMFRRMVVTGLENNELKADLKVSFVNPQGETIGEVLSVVNFVPNAKHHGQRINFASFTIQSEGEYEYRVSILEKGYSDFVDLYSIPLSVEKVP